jgi:multicomponent K+:H+ antiporter subunit D
VLAVTREAYGEAEAEEAVADVRMVVPGATAALAVCFAGCALLLAGMPPLSGFIGKFALLTAMLNPGGMAGTGAISGATWALAALLILSGFAALIAMTRAGISAFWATIEDIVPRVSVVEIAPVAFLLLVCVALTVQGGPVLRYMDATAKALYAPGGYVHDVLAARPVPPPLEGRP